MKFFYQYRTSDNIVHDGVVNAASRDTAFAVLKGRGIRPSRLVEAPGVFNKLFGKGKRWIAITVLAIIAMVAVARYVKTSKELKATSDFQTSQMRRQVIGDVAVIEKGIRTGWDFVFEHEGERFLASFAIPGVPAGQRATSTNELAAALNRVVEVFETDSMEVRQIKAMVEGMKSELRSYVAKGGTIQGYGQRLVRRQEEEVSYYRRAKSELETAAKSGMGRVELERLWESRNAALRSMGIKLVALPESENED